MAAHDAFVGLSGGLSTLATAVAKICNDIRLMTSSLGAGPELRLPDDGLSSSIMPGKRNATVCEAVLQVCAKVGANHAAILAGNNGGALQLNTCKPLILSSILDSLTLLADALDVLAEDCIAGLDVDADRLRERVEASAILGTLLAPEIGYDAAARIVRRVMAGECTLREAALEDGAFDGKRFDALLARMLDPATLDRGAAAGAIPTVQEAKR
jgi:fumarate hydratase class II